MPFFFLFLKNPKVIAVLLIVGLLTAGYFHYKGLVANLKTLEANAVKMDLAVEIQHKTIGVFKKSIDSWETSQNELIAQMEELKNVSEQAAAERGRLGKIFAKHNIAKLAARKPGLIEKRINRGTAHALSLFECATQGGIDCESDPGKTTRSKTTTAKPGTNKTKAAQVGSTDAEKPVAR